MFTGNKIEKIVSIAVILIALISTTWSWWQRDPSTRAAAAGPVPVIMDTDGGNLEVATVTLTNAFELRDPKNLLGLNLGETFSQIKVKVTYRYFIQMAKEWPMTLENGVLTVRAGEIKAQMPVAFDTSTMEKHTQNGWARFNKNENLDKLERSISPQLEKNAAGYQKLVTEAARKSVSRFVTTWLLKHYSQADGSIPRVQVFFPQE